MNNWLESEEKKKAIEELRKQKEVKNAQVLAQREDLIFKNLSAFYDLCNRVDKINYNFLKISRLTVTGGFNKKFELPREYRSSGTPPIEVYIYVYGIRGINFSVSNSNLIKIDIFWDLEKKGPEHYTEFNKTIRTIIFSKECSFQEILNWTEEKMTNIIRWIIFDFDTFEENLPGENEGLFEKEKRELLEKLNRKLNAAIKVLEKIQSFHIGRSQWDKKEQISDQQIIIRKLEQQILNIKKDFLVKYNT